MLDFWKWIVVSFLLITGGNPSVPTPEPPPSASVPSSAPDVLDRPMTQDGQVLRMNLGFEPGSLDVSQAQDIGSMTVLKGLYEGLTRSDENGNIVPAAASRWDVSPDGLTYTFHLNPKATWSNGDPVRAGDFEYSWKRTLDPNLVPGAPYAYHLYYLKNAMSYNTSMIDDSDAVGVKAMDDATLQVTLERATPYFLNLTSQVVYFPLHEDSVRANGLFSTAADGFVTNGPFRMAEWEHSEHIVLAKNESYRDAPAVRLREVRFAMIPDAGIDFALYDRGRLDWVGGGLNEYVSYADVLQRNSGSPSEIHTTGIGSLYYYVFNTTAKPLRNANIRKALQIGVDRQRVVDAVGPFHTPAYGFVPKGIRGAAGEYRAEHPDEALIVEDVAKAKELLRIGLEQEGLTELTVSLTHNNGEGHRIVAETVAAMWERNLGINVVVAEEEWGVFLSNRVSLKYEIARAGWAADYDDPMTFLEMYATGNGYNDAGWSDDTYDALLEEAYAEDDPKARTALMSRAEKLLLDEAVVAPLYYYSVVYAKKPYVQGVFPDVFGNIDFTRGRIAN